MNSRYRLCCAIAAAMLGSFILARESRAEQDKGEDDREVIGNVLGRKVYRDEIRKDEGLFVFDELRRLFVDPVKANYCKEHPEAVPTKEEIEAFSTYWKAELDKEIEGRRKEPEERLDAIDKQLTKKEVSKDERQQLLDEKRSIESDLDPEPVVRGLIKFWLNDWKFQKHLYDRFGGGSLFTTKMGGVQAGDAYRKWLKSRESSGDFKIIDASLRETLYRTLNIGGHLGRDDSEEVRQEFLEPPWKSKLKEKPKAPEKSKANEKSKTVEESKTTSSKK